MLLRAFKGRGVDWHERNGWYLCDPSPPIGPCSKLSFGDTLAATSLGQPYRWAQHLAGLDFLPSRKSDFALYVRSRLNLGTILDSIRAKAPAKR
jgi:hypothetical protein